MRSSLRVLLLYGMFAVSSQSAHMTFTCLIITRQNTGKKVLNQQEALNIYIHHGYTVMSHNS